MHSYFKESALPGKRAKIVRNEFLIKKWIYRGKSAFQKIEIFENPLFGKILALDGIVQLSEYDEAIYHEMLVHPLLFSHPSPKRLLIVGGGDGGALREACKHPLEEIVLCEIDEKVIELCKQHLPSVSKNAFSDKRVKLYIKPGEMFIKKYKNYFDGIILDSTDLTETNPSFPLFQETFYKDCLVALKENGMLMQQLGPYLDLENLLIPQFKKLNSIFSYIEPYRVTIPSFNCGEYCFVLCSKQSFEEKNSEKIQQRYEKLNKNQAFSYYSPSIHQAAKVLPPLWQRKCSL